jgi:ParB family chromosome partitioning protein
MAKLKGLGRGLDALLSGSEEAKAGDVMQSLAIDRIRSGRYQPRTRMDEAALAELTESIRVQGVVQPILVRPIADGRYEIVVGERRWRAAQRAGLKEIPALVRSVPDQAALAVALIENIQREDLNPLEEAQGIKRLIDEFGMTHEAAAQAVGRSRSAVTNLLRLTQLAPPVQALVLADKIDMGHARALLALPVSQQASAAAKIAAEGLSVRDAERLAHSLLHPEKRAARRAARRAGNGDLARLETELADALGATVRIEPTRKGAGRVVIRYSSLEQLDGILKKLR